MSIFKSTFPPFVTRQLQARQYLLESDGDRATNRNLHLYTSAKSAWVRMISLVNYDNPNAGFQGDQLARKYVLQAGTLYSNSEKDTNFTLRSGVGNARGSYAGNLGIRNGKAQRPLGIRPMPGITSVDIVNKGAFGSLRQATIKFKAWDKPQLDDLEVLFMRTGFWVTLEWGWSMYLDTSVPGENYDKISDPGSLIVPPSDLHRFTSEKQIQTFKDPTLNPFDTNLTLEAIYESFAKFRHKFSGNYDGMLGKIENFTFELAQDGSYDCTTVLISIGDVLDTLKMNRPRNTKSDFQTATEDAAAVAAANTAQTSFHNTMDKFILLEPGQFIDQELGGDGKVPTPWNANTSVDYYNHYTLGGNNKLNSDGASKPQSGVANNPSAGVNAQSANGITYIQFGWLIHIINVKNNLYDKQGNKYLEIVIPLPTKEDRNNGLCLASVDSISIDPVNVLVHNPKATFATGLPTGYDLNEVFRADANKVANSPTGLLNAALGQVSPPPAVVPFLPTIGSPHEYLVEGEPEGHSLGYIGNIYVSVQRLQDIFQDMIKGENSNYKGEVGIYTFLKKVLGEMSYALGSINDFDISPDENNVINIIDKNYCERAKDSRKENKFQLNIQGNNSVVRSFKIYSKIFQSQATEIAIAAQARDNLGGIYTATQRQFNQYLNNRIYYDLTTHEEKSTSKNAPPKLSQSQLVDQQKKKQAEQDKIDRQAQHSQYILDLAKDVLELRKWVQPFLKSASLPDSTTISTANTYLKSTLIEVNCDSNFRAPIPLSLEVTVDGIGGIVIGQVFTVNTDTLPQDYARNALGFMVTALNSHIIGSDWVTTIGTKPILLNQDTLGSASQIGLKNEVQQGIAVVEGTQLQAALAYVQAYLKIMCLVKLYYEGNLYIEATVNESSTGVVTLGSITNIGTPLANSYILFHSSTNNALTVGNAYNEIVDAGYKINYNGALTVGNNDVANYLKSNGKQIGETKYYLKGKQVSAYYSNGIYADNKVTTYSGDLSAIGRYGSSEAALIKSIVTKLTDYTSLPNNSSQQYGLDLKQQIISNLNTLENTGVVVNGIRSTQDPSSSNIVYVEDASFGSIKIKGGDDTKYNSNSTITNVTAITGGNN